MSLLDLLFPQLGLDNVGQCLFLLVFSTGNFNVSCTFCLVGSAKLEIGENAMSIGMVILLVLVILIATGHFGMNWGNGTSGGLGLVLIVVLILVLMGKI